jgi:hypothetical protein
MTSTPTPARILLWRAISQCAGARWHSLATLTAPQGSGRSKATRRILQLMHRIQVCARQRLIQSQLATDTPEDSTEDNVELLFHVEMAFQYLRLAEQRLLLDDDQFANLNCQKFIHSLLAAAAEVLGEGFTSEEQEPILKTAQHLPSRLHAQLDIRHAVHSGSLPEQLVFVLGMHRSGTSALSGLLCQSGFSAPLDLMPATNNNPRGYWESLGICQINEEFLISLNASWNGVYKLPLGWEDHPNTQAWRRRLLQHLQNIFAGCKWPVIKDPRFSILLRGMAPWLESGWLRAKMLLMFRDPLEVARSLEKAEKTPIHVGIQLWLQHIFEAEKLSRGYPRLSIGYEDLLENPDQQLENCRNLADSDADSSAISLGTSFITSELHRQHRKEWEEEFLRNTNGISSAREIAIAIFDLLSFADINSSSTISKIDIHYAHWRLLPDPLTTP